MRAGHVVLQPQQLRLRQQRLGRFRLRGDGAGRSSPARRRGRRARPTAGRRPAAAPPRSARPARPRAKEFCASSGFLQPDQRIAARDQDRRVEHRVLAVRLQLVQQFLELVLRQQRLGQQRHRLMRDRSRGRAPPGLTFGGHRVAEFEATPGPASNAPRRSADRLRTALRRSICAALQVALLQRPCARRTR